MAAAVERCTTCGGKLVSRSDDCETVVRDRLKVYWRETQPMIAYYHARPTYRAVDGAQAPERVRDALVTADGVGARQAGGRIEAVVGSAAGVERVIVVRSAAEIERLARVNALVARVLAELKATVAAGGDDGGARRAGRAASCPMPARSRRSRGTTAIRRRFARR